MVTGATGNLGQTVVRAYLEAGAHVAIPVRDAEKAEALRGGFEIRADHGLPEIAGRPRDDNAPALECGGFRSGHAA